MPTRTFSTGSCPSRRAKVDPTSNTLTAEAGVTLGRAREAAEQVDRLYPLLLPSEGSCTVGGNLSTNAGGTQALSYGIARQQVLGLEVVLADGRVLNNLNKLKKDNTGYDLKNLFIGAEGTLGIITAAVLKLFPAPRAVETAFVGLNSTEDALALLNLLQSRAGNALTSFELIARTGMEFVFKHLSGARDPLASIWIGNRTRIAAHHDLPDNLACVVAGRRRFTLFPPDELPNLYIGPLDFTPAGQAISLVDFAAPDFVR